MPEFHYTISQAALKEVELSELQESYQHLVSLFREHAEKILPRELKQSPAAHQLIRLSKKLAAVEDCEGFEDHLRLYREGTTAPLFVALLAGHFRERGAIVSFEPRTTGSHKADLGVSMQADEMIVECKTLESAKFETLDEHLRMFDALAPYIDFHYHVAVHYRRSLNVDELRVLGEAVRKRLPHVTEDGVILALSDPELEVKIDRRVGRLPEKWTVMLGMVGPEPSDNVVVPGHAIIKEGRNMAFYGPVIDFAYLLQDRVRKARRQAPAEAPYVIAISESKLLGSPRKNRVAIQSMFQPKQNRRISGVLLADFVVYVGGKEGAKLEYLPNSFATYPLPEPLQALLR